MEYQDAELILNCFYQILMLSTFFGERDLIWLKIYRFKPTG